WAFAREFSRFTREIGHLLVSLAGLLVKIAHLLVSLADLLVKNAHLLVSFQLLLVKLKKGALLNIRCALFCD
uniref:hypothetical protein n=1 Tax=unclassified Bacillus (in: firmicutes) TaxID=185979 RepID=UPI0006605940